MLGIANLGNTCFINSVLQALLHTPAMQTFYECKPKIVINMDNSTEPNDKPAFIFTFQMADLFEKYWATSGQKHIVPQDLIKSIILANNMYSTMQQQDAHEFLIFALDLMHTALREKCKTEIRGQIITRRQHLIKHSLDQYIGAFQEKFSPIGDIFFGQTVNYVRCTYCGYNSTTFDITNHITVAIPTHRSHINDVLMTHFSGDTLSDDNKYKCEKCKNMVNAVKQNKSWNLPPVLIIHLKRFNTTNGITYVKNPVQIQFDQVLDMSNFSDYNKGMYKLYAIVNHTGNMNGGHYYTYALHNDNWYEFNDSHVGAVGNVVTQNAYMLFYYKI